MRFWDRAINPDSVAPPRFRSTVRGVPPHNLWGQRPLFSRPDEENEPDVGVLPPEARLDDLVPIDEGEGSQARADLLATEDIPPTILAYSTDNVAFPPTDAQLTTAFGNRRAGFTALIIDNGGVGSVYLVVKSKSDTWWYELLTKAV